VVFESDQRPGRDVLDLGVDDDVADEALLAGLSPYVDHADAGESLAFGGLVVVTKKLVAAADRKHRRTCVNRTLEWRLLVLEQVFVNESLLAVLPAAEEEDVDVFHVLSRSSWQLDEPGVVIAPLRALQQREDVASVAVDVH